MLITVQETLPGAFDVISSNGHRNNLNFIELVDYMSELTGREYQGVPTESSELVEKFENIKKELNSFIDEMLEELKP